MDNNYIATIAITSFNRFKYFRSLLNSLSKLSREKFYFIVVDNCSKEAGLQDYILEKEESGEIHKAFIRSSEERNWVNDEYIAKNIIIENSPSEMILFLQDDLQFVGNESILTSIVEDFHELPGMCLELNGVRKISTLNKFASRRDLYGNSGLKYWVPDDNHFQTMGLFKKQVFRVFGEYPVNWPPTQEFWGRSEDVYDAMIKQKFPQVQLNLTSHIPIFLPVWNDIRGGYAFIRGDRRYAQYIEAPHSSGLYYDQFVEDDIKEMTSVASPISFPEIAKPIGWSFARDENGDQKKYSQKEVMQEEFGEEF